MAIRAPEPSPVVTEDRGGDSISTTSLMKFGPSGARSIVGDDIFNPSLAMHLGAGSATGDAPIAHAATYRAMHVRAEALAKVPIRVRGGSRRDPKDVDSGPLLDLAESPNPILSAFEFWYVVVQMMDRGGGLLLPDPFKKNGYVPGSIPQELWPVSMADWEPVRSRSNRLGVDQITHWRSPGDGGLQIPREQVIELAHSSGLDPWRQLFEAKKSSPLKAAAVAIETDRSAADYARSFVKNDCNPSAWVIVKSLPDEKRKQLQAAIHTAMSGTSNAGKAAVLSGIENIIFNASTHREMQFLEGRAFSIDEIAAAFGTDKNLIGFSAEKTNRATMESLQRAFHETTVRGLISAVEDAMWTQLWSKVKGGQWWSWNLQAVPWMQRDRQEAVAIFTALTATGVPPTIAATMADLEMERFAGDDVGLVQMGMIPREEAANGAALPEPLPALEALPDSEADQLPEDQTLPIEVMTMVQSVIAQVTDGTLPAESAKTLLAVSTPLDASEIDGLIDPADEAREEAKAKGEAITAAGDETDNDPPPPGDGGEVDEEDEPESEDLADARTVRTHSGATAPEARASLPRGPRDRVRSAISIVQQRREQRAAKAKATWARFSRDVSTPHEKRFQGFMRARFSEMRRDTLAAFDEELERSALPANVALPHSVRMGIGPFLILRIAANLAKWRRLLGEKAEKHYASAIAAAGKASNAEMGLDPLDFDAANPRWLELIQRRAGVELVGVTDETIRQVREAMITGLVENETPQQIRARLSKLDAFSSQRAKTVAITEIGGVVNTVREGQMDEVGVEEHEWATVGDPKVRDTHSSVDGERRRRGERFSNGLIRPHDPLGAAGEVINCRCGTVAVIDLDEDDL